MKLFNNIRVLAIFFLILIPLLYLYFYFEELAESNKITTEELIKEQLLSEMSRFQNDLIPERYIENAFKDLNSFFKFPEIVQGQYSFNSDDEEDLNFIDKDFIDKANIYLRGKYGFEPFVFISSSYDLTNINLEDKENIFNSNENRNRFLYNSLKSVIQDTIDQEDEDLFVEPIKNETANIFSLENKKIHYYSKGSKRNFNLEVAKNISIFYKKISRPKVCNAFLANRFGNQRVYEYHNCLLSKNNKKLNLLGLYYVLIKGSDIDIKKLLYSACYNLDGLNNSKIKRKISDNALKSPAWNFSDDIIEYNIPFPSQFYNFVAEHRATNEEIYNVYKDYFQNHSLTVSIERKSIPNSYLVFKDHITQILYLVIFFIIIYLLNIPLKLIKLNLSLSLKVRFVVFVAVMIPMIGLWIISYLGLKNEEKILISKTEKSMSDRLGLFDKLKNDIINDLSIDLMKHKKSMSDCYFESTPDNFFFKAQKKNMFTQMFISKELFDNTFNLYDYVHLLDRDGKSILFKDSYAGYVDFKRIIPLYKMLSDMNLLNNNSPENKKNREKNIGLSLYLDSYLSVYNKNNVLAKESFLIPSEDLTSKNKVSYQLLASKDKPLSPKALTYSYLNMRDIMAYRLNLKIKEKYLELLSQNLPFAQIKYAIFEIRESSFREIIKQPIAQPFRQFQLESVNKAVALKNSSIESRETDNYYIITAWKYYNDNPAIFVGTAIVPKSQFKFVTGEIIAFVLLIYSLLAVILLSDFFASALLDPIKTLSKFVKELSLGHLNVNVDMKTGDEMQDLSDSFNKMSEGLCEREKLKRFVSDKLYTSIEKSEEQTITNAKVTILSSDIRSFTTISEQNEPENVVKLLNDYFTLMEKSIVKYGGSIEKIVGDAIVAAFYEEKQSDYAYRACQAALEMRESLKKFNKERISEGLFPIENGIGLASGDVMIGFAGEKARRREFLLMGEIIKISEKLESMTKGGISSKIFIDRQTYEFVKNKVKFCDEIVGNETFYREIKI